MAGSVSATTASLIAAIAGLAGTGVGAYESHDAGINQAAAQKNNADALKAQQQAQANQASLTKQEAVLGAQGQAQAQTGGSLTDSGTSALTDLLAGYPGFQSGSPGTGATPNTSVGTGIGSSGVPVATEATGAGAGTPDIAALLAKLRSGTSNGNSGGGGLGSISGGNWQFQSSAPQGHFELSNPVL